MIWINEPIIFGWWVFSLQRFLKEIFDSFLNPVIHDHFSPFFIILIIIVLMGKNDEKWQKI